MLIKQLLIYVGLYVLAARWALREEASARWLLELGYAKLASAK